VLTPNVIRVADVFSSRPRPSDAIYHALLPITLCRKLRAVRCRR